MVQHILKSKNMYSNIASSTLEINKLKYTEFSNEYIHDTYLTS